MPDLFKEIIPSILQTKTNVFEEETDYKDYNPFIINRSLSYHLDCIFYVNEMNINHHIDKDVTLTRSILCDGDSIGVGCTKVDQLIVHTYNKRVSYRSPVVEGIC